MEIPPVSKEISVEDLVYHYPEATGFLLTKGLQCIICGEPVWGTLEELARGKNFTDDQLNELISELRGFLAHQ